MIHTIHPHLLYTTLLSKTQAIQNMHPPKTPKQVHAFLGFSWILQKIYLELCWNSQTINPPDIPASKIQLDTNSPQFFLKAQGINHPSANTTLPKSPQTLHSIYWCIRWHLWSTIIPGTWWYRVPYCLSFTYIFRNTKEMEHHGTGSLWSLMHNHQMELLSPRSRYYTTKQVP